jgi:hypothetical protein
MLATLSAADSSGTLEQDVVVTAYVQTIQAETVLPGSAAIYDANTEAGQAARLQFRTGVSTTLSIALDNIFITSVTDSAGSGRRRTQTGGVVVDYTAVAGDDVAAHFENATFADVLVENINEAGDALDEISAEDVTVETVSVETDVTFEVVTDVTENTDSSGADGLVSSVLDDTSGLLTELNEEGADVSGASTQAVSANNCTANTFVANSDRSITGTPCFGVTNEACGFTCNDGYTKFGDHICNPDGTFSGGVCAPAGKVPFRCGTTGDLVFVTSVALPPPPPGSMSGNTYSATGSTMTRFQQNPPPPPPAEKICGRGP